MSIKNRKWLISDLNFMDEVRADMKIPSRIIVSDCTLRDGEQQPGVVLGMKEKLQIARKLDEVGIPEIEAGMPIVSNQEMETVKAIVKENLSARITAFCRALKEDVDAALKSGVWGVRIGIPTSFVMREYKLKLSEDETIQKMLNIVQYAKDYDLYVIVSATDSTRSDINFLKKYFTTLVREAKADHIRLPDSHGCIIPQAVEYLVKELRKAVGVPIEVHFHDDFGLATANTLAAITSGAEITSTTVNGIGERAGNAPTEEVLLALLILYNINLRVKYEKLYELSKLVQKLTKVPVQAHKAIVGENAFAHEAAITATIDEFPLASEAYLPEVVGHSRRVVLGKKSGKQSIIYKLNQLGIEVKEERIPSIVARVKQESERKRRQISDKEFEKIVRELR